MFPSEKCVIRTLSRRLAKLYPIQIPAQGAEAREQRGPESGIVLDVVRTVVRAIVRAISRGTVVVVEHPRRHGPHNRRRLHTAMQPIPGFDREPDLFSVSFVCHYDVVAIPRQCAHLSLQGSTATVAIQLINELYRFNSGSPRYARDDNKIQEYHCHCDGGNGGVFLCFLPKFNLLN